MSHRGETSDAVWETRVLSEPVCELIPSAEESTSLKGVWLMLKRAIDLMLGSSIAVLISPVLLIIWLLVRFTSKGPAIYIQRRVGYKGRVFNCYKFRTMYVDADDDIHRKYVKQWIANRSYDLALDKEKKLFKIMDDPRVTAVGRFLRRYSLDELPQIFNVLKLEMSLVGPRPALEYEVKLYRDWHKQRLLGVPGVTGLWQVTGRNHLSFDEMVRLDIEYLNRWSLLYDLTLILKTIPVVFQGNGH